MHAASSFENKFTASYTDQSLRAENYIKQTLQYPPPFPDRPQLLRRWILPLNPAVNIGLTRIILSASLFYSRFPSPPLHSSYVILVAMLPRDEFANSLTHHLRPAHIFTNILRWADFKFSLEWNLQSEVNRSYCENCYS